MNDLKKENGYILVVVIGILTILSLMAITFATLSRIETRATRNYTDSVKCEAVAKAGLEHALYVLRLDKFGADTIAYNGDNGDENYDWSGETWMPGNIDLANPITSFAGSDTSYYDNDGDSIPDSKWIYFPVTATTGTNTTAIRLPGNLLARYAILITDDSEARVNINVTGNKAGGGVHTSNEGWSTFEINLSNIIELAATGKGIATASDIIDARFGTDTLPGTIGDDNPGIVPNPQTDGIDNDGDLIVDEALEDTDEPNEFNPISPYIDDVPFGLLTEAEIMGTSSYTSRLEDIFGTNTVSQTDQETLKGWLTTYSADTIVCPPYTLGTSTATTTLNINALVNNEGAYTDTGTYDSDKKVEMIIDILTAGGVPDVEHQQLAVNIKDFIDSDGTVTTYLDSPDTYYGVERTPYINEVEAEVNGATAGGLGKYIELFNPYDADINITNWTIKFGTDTITLGGTIAAQDYYVIADNQGAYENSPGGFAYEGIGIPPEQTDANVNNLTTTGETITLSDNNNNIVQVTNYGQAEIDTKTRQLNDPRPTPLSATPSDPWLWVTSLETAGEENATFDPNIGGDGWENITPTWPDSFLIANRRFSNKGYMGFIHRGSQWTSFKVDDTIAYPNVLQYFTITDPSMDNIDNDGDGDIDSVDTGTQTADIDGREYRIPGLINVNTAPVEVLESLPNITNAIATAIEGSGSKPFTSIGHLVDVVTEITGTTGTKWDKEKRFRSISNLITTRSNVFTVYVTAQITDEAISNVFAEKRIMAIVDRSVDPIKVRYFRWMTE
ncbi:MAG: hypothetical protein A3H23_03570 [Planctomycetes bacterium RIFCSPLOWO2_12_FULL_40_19]|nr:MAG: hypothetical protein A3H23_03570 [Planctomycetes bacterium RIFCSPLOWO2_12_FULL_40_19]